ncbi:HD-GYP domain-containing protein [Neobacillus bataviensis LMG 21833]|uniref:HD-GYP domain-containing protein n=1 Tax=Neobacillus bataviensis LMG 21833 TaxID=1117379 RepID=K6DEF8_9BACI|nr:HD-GYP domain-containing protein [Neobacillus bataviensis]EKN70937.1 HD-GYP domain-containing protein [Neobacillus bataviensis LMG 21833]
MLDKFFEKIGNYIYFRYVFFILLSLSLVLSIVFPHNDNFALFMVAVSFLGIGFHNKPVFLVCFTVLVVYLRFQFVPKAEESVFLTYLVTYFLVTLTSAGMTLYIQKVKKDSLDLTKTLVNALESRDTYTSDHSDNVSRYAVQIAEKMNLSKDLCNIIRTGGLLHDIGKIGIPEHILTKPGRLTSKEYTIIKTHPEIGYEILKHVDGLKKNGVLDIVLYHHERFDGTGYPKGLKGSEIPLVARIVGVADAFDAMISKRVYRNGLDLNFAINEIRRNKGIQFDPEVADAFLRLFKEENIKVERTAINLVESHKKTKTI